MGLVRVGHPFPSVLDGLVVAAVAIVAGAGLGTALRLGLAMTALQVAIGALNDLRDAPLDTGRKPGKPIPAGAVRPAAAAAIVAGGLAVGLLLSAMSGPSTLLVALAGAGIGFAYDLWLKGTPWSWLPFAAGIPLLPLFAWLGGTGSLPDALLALVPPAIAAGAALAIGNALVDVERDRAAGVRSVATALGPTMAWASQAILFGFALAVLAATVPGGGLVLAATASGRGGTFVAGLGAVGVVLGLGVSHSPSPDRRERGWELQAIGTGLAAAGWTWAAVSSGAL